LQPGPRRLQLFHPGQRRSFSLCQVASLISEPVFGPGRPQKVVWRAGNLLHGQWPPNCLYHHPQAHCPDLIIEAGLQHVPRLGGFVRRYGQNWPFEKIQDFVRIVAK
jgi:hypothetical protein